MRTGNLAVFFLALVAASVSIGCSQERNGTHGGPSDMSAIGGVTQVVIAPGAPSDAPNQFGGPVDPTVAPTLVYPPDGVIMPPNLSELEVQWRPSGNTSLYELRFVSTLLDLTIYTGCNAVADGCGFIPDEATWQLMSQQSRGDKMSLTLRATAGGSSGVGASAPQSLAFTDEDLLGGLYYWAADPGQIVRYDFGKRGQTAEVFYDAASSGATCVGCHALSRDGARIAVGLNAPTPTAALRALDVASKSTLFDRGTSFGGGSNFEAFSPDGMRLLVNDGADLTLLDSTTGNQIGSAPVVTNGNLPDWSADGSHVVFARPSSCPVPGLCGSLGVDGADLYSVEVTGDTFGTPKLIVTGGGNNFYPTHSPDGTLVAFNRSAGNSNSFDALDARLWVVSPDGGTPVELVHANSSVGDSWPKFAPFSHHYKGETIFWLTFSSRRDYGLRILNSQAVVMPMNDTRTAQIWMVGVPASVLQAGTQPAGGYPAFWLPFQSMKSGNHIAQWTESVARLPCNQADASPCPGGEVCEDGECVGVPVL